MATGNLQSRDAAHLAGYVQVTNAVPERAPAAMGSYGSSRYPLRVRGVDGLLMVGHDSIGIDYAAETIGYAALRLHRVLEREVERRCRK